MATNDMVVAGHNSRLRSSSPMHNRLKAQVVATVRWGLGACCCPLHPCSPYMYSCIHVWRGFCVSVFAPIPELMWCFHCLRSLSLSFLRIRLYSCAHMQVFLIPGDTFRAAAAEQLMEWGRRANVTVGAFQDRAKPQKVIAEVGDCFQNTRQRSTKVLAVACTGEN